MNVADLLTQGLDLVNGVDYRVVITIFVINLTAESTGLTVPYLQETTLLFAGYQLSTGAMPLWGLIVLLLAALLGRELGAFLLYSLSASGSRFLEKFKRRFISGMDISKAFPFNLFQKIDLLSPVAIALGRLLWLRIPLTLVLGAQRKWKVLMIAIVPSALVYDGTFVALGAVMRTTTRLQPVQVLYLFAGGLTVLYALSFIIGRFVARRR